MKTVWITRTETQSSNDAPTGWRSLNIPLLNVVPTNKAPDPPQQNDVLVFTSGNAVRMFGTFTDLRHWPVYTVGDATAERARKAGFTNIVSAGKDVAALRDMLTRGKSLTSKRLYYASGKEISGNLEADLRKNGLAVARNILYETTANLDVSPKIRTEIEKGGTLAVLLYSPKGAQAFRSLDLDFTKLETVSISTNVDNHLKGLGLKRRTIAENPTHQALIKQLV